jgi:simple sugar transport system permease protein
MSRQLNRKKEFKSNDFLIAISAVILGLVAGAILMAAIGSNPFTGFLYLFKGGLMNIERIGNTIATATTLMLVGLSVAFAFKTGLFNIGASGQMLVGGLCATLVAHHVVLPRPLYLIVLVLSALLGGALWGVIPGLLKAKFNVHEVVATIMMNWIAYWSIYYFVPAYLKGPSLETESASIALTQSLRAGWLTSLFNGSYMNLGFFVAIISVVVIKLILDKTTLGFELKAVGSNRFCAEYAGIKVNRNVVISMMIAGGLAGLAGLTYYTGYSRNMQIGVMPSQGFDGIAVALLGASNPIGVFFSALFFGMLQSGKGFMNAMTSVPPEIADTIIATIIYFTATSVLFKKFWDSVSRRLAFRRESKEALAAEALAVRNVAQEAADEAYELTVSDTDAQTQTGVRAGAQADRKVSKPMPPKDTSHTGRKPTAGPESDSKEVK